MGRIPAFRSPSRLAAESWDTSPSLGSVTFLCGSSDPSQVLLCFLSFISPAAHSTPAHLHDHTCTSPLEQRAIPPTSRTTLRKMTAETTGVTCWTSYWSNLAMKTGFTPLLLLVEKKPDNWVYALDKENMPSTPGPLEPFCWFWFYQLGRTQRHVRHPIPPDRHVSSEALLPARLSIPVYIASLGFTCPTLGTWKLDI